ERRLVRRGVVHDPHFPVRISLIQNGFHALAQIVADVVRRRDDGDERLRYGHTGLPTANQGVATKYYVFPYAAIPPFKSRKNHRTRPKPTDPSLLSCNTAARGKANPAPYKQ